MLPAITGGGGREKCLKFNPHGLIMKKQQMRSGGAAEWKIAIIWEFKSINTSEEAAVENDVKNTTY